MDWKIVNRSEWDGNRMKKEVWGTLASMLFHSIKYAPGQTGIWVMLHSLKGVKQIPDPPFPSPLSVSRPTVHKLPVQMSVLLFIKQVHCLPIHGGNDKKRLAKCGSNHICVCVYVCLWMLMLYCVCRISCQPLLTWGPTVRHSQKNQYSFQWSWPTYSELLTAHWRLVCCSETVNL